MEIIRIGNIIEGFFWIGIALFFLVPALQPKEKHRVFCLFGAGVFIFFGCSDFYEARTGAWWKPWWLILWNIGCMMGIIFIVIWYVKIMGSMKNVLEKWYRPLTRKNKES